MDVSITTNHILSSFTHENYSDKMYKWQLSLKKSKGGTKFMSIPSLGLLSNHRPWECHTSRVRVLSFGVIILTFILGSICLHDGNTSTNFCFLFRLR